MNNIEELARKWLSHKRHNDISGIAILPQMTSVGLIVWFYWEETGEDLEYFLTVPMVKELQEGRSPRKVTNGNYW